MDRNTLQRVTAQLLTIVLALVFAAAGAAKLAGVETTTIAFERLGLPWGTYLVGVLEILCAIGLFLQGFRFPAAMALVATMGGALAYHLVLDPERAFVPSLTLLVLSALLSWLRAPRKDRAPDPA
ncbi:MAG: DoxX family protein [Pseudomonadota bacterium]